ncbi:MAG: ABC transporter substrate-binding protein [Dethiobacter sp.]|nr:ABC transporter substrate-binding protein [Dethiobacter sp.]
MKRYKLTILFLVIAALLVFMATGCTQKAEEKEQIAKGIKVVNIGYTGPLSGPAAEYGKDAVNGIEFAIADINEAGGINIDGQPYIFRLVQLDDGASPVAAATNTARLRDVFGAKFIYNPVMTCLAPMLEKNQEKGNEFIVMAYTSVPAELTAKNELAVWLPPPFFGYATAFPQMAWDEGWRTCAMIVTAGDYGDSWRAKFRQEWEALGGTVTADLPVQYYAVVDYSTQITSAMATNPDFMLIGGPSGPTALVVDQAREMGYEGGFVFIDQAKMDYVAKKLQAKGGLDYLGTTIGVISPYESPYPAIPEWITRYEAYYGGRVFIPTWEAAINYTATFALVRAMEAAGTVDDVYAIKKAFPEVFPFLGKDFPIEYMGISEYGRLKMIGTVDMIKNGKYTGATPTIWFANTDAEFEEYKKIMTLNPGVEPIRIKYP